MTFSLCVCTQAACGDVLQPGQEPGEAGRVLLHAGGLPWSGEAGQLPAREPLLAHGQ